MSNPATANAHTDLLLQRQATEDTAKDDKELVLAND